MGEKAPFSELSETNFDTRFELAENQLDILQSRGYEMNKIGELIRLIDFLRAVSRGEKADLPEPDPKLYANLGDSQLGKHHVQIQLSSDERFARSVYGIIPGAVKTHGLAGALTMLENFLQTEVENTDK